MYQIISQYICANFMMICIILFSKMILNKKIDTSYKNIILICQFTSAFHVGIYFFLSGIQKTLLMILVNVLFCKKIFKESYKNSLLISILYVAVLIIPNLIELFLFVNVFHISREFLYDTYAGSILGNLSINILLLIITFIFRNFLKYLVNGKLKNNSKIVIFSILIFLCSIMFFYELINKFRDSNNILLYLLSIIVLVSMLISMIKQSVENYRLTREYDNLLKFMISYENEIEEQRIMRHETKNEFLTIRAKIYDKQNNQEIIEYIDEIIDEKLNLNIEKYAKFGYLPPNGIKGLCYFKTQEAENKQITVSINIAKRVKKSIIYKLNIKEQKDLGRILGVILDNAIEACYQSIDKKIGIEAYANKNSCFKMIVSNTFDNKKNIGKSTKGAKRGHGLLLVKYITDKNDKFKVKTEINNNLYIQTIMVINKTNH